MATGTSAVVTDQEVKAVIVGALGLLSDEVEGLLELLPPPQALKQITPMATMK